MPYQFVFDTSISNIPANIWDSLINSTYPFSKHSFLSQLEKSGCASPETGWHPQHLVIYEAHRSERSPNNPKPIGVMPLYLKQHSRGEYVFDWQWAEAYAQYGLPYYPKLVTAIPFTPSSGPRLGLQLEAQSRTQDPNDENMSSLYQQITQAVRSLADKLHCSSWHCLFTPLANQNLWRQTGLLHRQGVQFHWHNQRYQSFDDFLSTLTSRKRKSIKRERRQIKEAGITFTKISGKDITEQHWQTFFQFYSHTYLVRGQRPYLSLGFFQGIAGEMAEQIMLIFALNAGKTVAGALFFQDQTTLYGRYWGSLADYNALHFETCYYQGIEYAIETKLKRFDAGAQGEHKLKRGFAPCRTDSWHWITEPNFRHAIDQALQAERPMVDQYFDAADKATPFKK